MTTFAELLHAQAESGATALRIGDGSWSYREYVAEAQLVRHTDCQVLVTSDRSRPLLDGGWYWSGDLAYRDAEGWLYFAGRSNEWLRVDGENPPRHRSRRSSAVTPMCGRSRCTRCPTTPWATA